ncbi:MAG: TetR/AcrR family transcriptional regulator [Treponema sp.]|jgi:AcrR family transcriptional regulator|nr:TetR/AcrR family transcriptional regulator [Treponema sp.]
MTNDDIIRAALKAWGRELYKTTSLTLVARELGVSKPALYRHFKDKQALLDAMYQSFFENYVIPFKKVHDTALKVSSLRERLFILMRSITEFYLQNNDFFLFSLIQVYGCKKMHEIFGHLEARGIDMKTLFGEIRGFAGKKSVPYPSKVRLVLVTSIFWVAHFHCYGYKGVKPGEALVKKMVAFIEAKVARGLSLKEAQVKNLDYEALEKIASQTVYADTEDNKLLMAVAEAVAEAGPWNASMEMVARKSGLSKSGLYSHFKSRQDMLGRLFITEFNKIIDYSEQSARASKIPEEQLYLAIISIVEYLRSRPEILVALNWIKTRRLDLGVEVPQTIYRAITGIKLKVIKEDGAKGVYNAQWILFMVVSVLTHWTPKSIAQPPVGGGGLHIAKVPNESFRILFKFITCGLEGFNL